MNIVPLLVVFVAGLLGSGVVPVSELEKGNITINKEILATGVVLNQEEYEKRMND